MGTIMKSEHQLRTILEEIDGRGYKSYQSIQGVYQFSDYQLSIDHVQGDPFAAPSKVSIRIEGTKAEFPLLYFDKPYKRIALQDYLLCLFSNVIKKISFQVKGSGKSGMIITTSPKAEILERTSCTVNQTTGDLIMRLEIGFPAYGRTVCSTELITILFQLLPSCIKQTLYFNAIDQTELQETIFLAENQYQIRKELQKRGLVAFIANGSILPRESGVSDRPLKNAIPFQSPKSLEVSINLLHGTTITGMGIKKGVTLIVGGGYHGKSTLLQALELGVYNHRKKDGREYVITDESAIKLRAEDGRSIKQVNISYFISNLPNKKDTCKFSTEDASGSTSQAANLIEGMEAGATVFLIDEDTSATNFMIRDKLMQQVIVKEMEPITPFIDRVRQLYEQQGISTILVAGSCGTYFYTADTILQMEHYEPIDITQKVNQIITQYPQKIKKIEEPINWNFYNPRIMLFNRKKEERIKIKANSTDSLFFNKDVIDLRYVEQLVDSEQVIGLGYLLNWILKQADGKTEIKVLAERIWKIVNQKGLESLFENHNRISAAAMPRKQELFACLNRYRQIKLVE